jgi:hypothetical protein
MNNQAPRLVPGGDNEDIGRGVQLVKRLIFDVAEEPDSLVGAGGPLEVRADWTVPGNPELALPELTKSAQEDVDAFSLDQSSDEEVAERLAMSTFGA